MSIKHVLLNTINDFALIFRFKSPQLNSSDSTRIVRKYRTISNFLFLALIFGTYLLYSLIVEWTSSYDETEVMMNLFPLSPDKNNNSIPYFCRVKLHHTDLNYMLNLTQSPDEKDLIFSFPESSIGYKPCTIMRYDSPHFLETKGTLIVVYYNSDVNFTTTVVDSSRRQFNLSSSNPLRFLIRNPKALVVQHSNSSFSLVNTPVIIDQELKRVELKTEERLLEYVITMHKKLVHRKEYDFTLENTKVLIQNSSRSQPEDITHKTLIEKQMSYVQIKFSFRESITKLSRTFIKVSGDFKSSDPLLRELDGKTVMKYELTEKTPSSWMMTVLKCVGLVGMILLIIFIVLFISNLFSTAVVKKDKKDQRFRN